MVIKGGMVVTAEDRMSGPVAFPGYAAHSHQHYPLSGHHLTVSSPLDFSFRAGSSCMAAAARYRTMFDHTGATAAVDYASSKAGSLGVSGGEQEHDGVMDFSMRGGCAGIGDKEAGMSANESLFSNTADTQRPVDASSEGKKLRFDVSGVGSDGDAGSVLHSPSEDDESRKRRELLARRPSYRKIFNELSDSGISATVPKVEDDGVDSNDSLMSNDDLPSHSFSQSGSGLQTFTMTNAMSAQVAQNSGATIVQCASDGQFFIPGSNISYQIAPAQVVVMGSGGSGSSNGGTGEEASRKRELRLLKNRYSSEEMEVLGSMSGGLGPAGGPPPLWMNGGGVLDPNSGMITPMHPGDDYSGLSSPCSPDSPRTTRRPRDGENSRKLELRLLKNREAARECRRKKKEYIKCLENRVALLENQNKTLIEELKSLKELYCQKETHS